MRIGIDLHMPAARQLTGMGHSVAPARRSLTELDLDLIRPEAIAADQIWPGTGRDMEVLAQVLC